MNIRNLFDEEGMNATIQRIEQLSINSKAKWGKMNVSQMLAHCCVAYEMTYGDKHKKPNAFLKFILKLMVKNAVVSEKPYPKNGKTAPAFIISDQRDFTIEKDRLIEYLRKTQQLGADHFELKESHSFGPLSKQEWNNMFSKHIDHHLRQFGV